MMTKNRCKEFNETSKKTGKLPWHCWKYAYQENGFIIYTREIIDSSPKQWATIKVTESDLLDGSYKTMFAKGLSR